MKEKSETEKELICSATDCETDVVGDACCYNLPRKMHEFLHKDAYMLEYKDTIKRDDNIDRMRVLYSKFFQPYSVLPTKKMNKGYKDTNQIYREYNEKYFNTFGIIPLELIPASYIPFNYKNYDMNMDRLTKGEIFYEDDYKRMFIDYHKQPDPNNTTHFNEKGLKEYLEICLKGRLANPKAIFNAFSITMMTQFICVVWTFIIVMMLYILFYYYREIYSYILLSITIILVFVAIIIKMMNILSID